MPEAEPEELRQDRRLMIDDKSPYRCQGCLISDMKNRQASDSRVPLVTQRELGLQLGPSQGHPKIPKFKLYHFITFKGLFKEKVDRLEAAE